MMEAIKYTVLSAVESVHVLSAQVYIMSVKKAAKTCMHLLPEPRPWFLTCLEILSPTLRNKCMAEASQPLTPRNTP